MVHVIQEWGDASWGAGYWGSEQFNIIADHRNLATAQSEWDYPITFAPESNMRALVGTLLAQGNRIDADLERIYEAQHIDSASGESLETWGQLVNVDRKTGEQDDKYRARIKAEFRQSTIEPTFEQFSEFCAEVIGTDIDNLEFIVNLSGDPATVDVGLSEAALNDLGFTESELQDLYGGGVPAGHEVQIFQNGTFRLKSDGESDTASDGLTSDSISTGGTLAEDLV